VTPPFIEKSCEVYGHKVAIHSVSIVTLWEDVTKYIALQIFRGWLSVHNPYWNLNCLRYVIR